MKAFPGTTTLLRTAFAAAAMAVFLLSIAPISVPSGRPGDLLTPDMGIHFAVHATLGGLAVAAWGARAGLLVALGLAVCFEAVQLATAARSFTGPDLAANLAGAALGALVAARAVSLWRGRG